MVRETQPECKTAERPHYLTIILSVLAIVVSVISSTVSIYSVDLAKRNYHQQTRAWLFVKNVNWGTYWFDAVLVNEGKTPAYLPRSSCTETNTYNPVSRVNADVIGPASIRLGPIPPHQTEDLRLGIPRVMTNTLGKTTKVICGVSYRDIFGDEHRLKLCYVLGHVGGSVGECNEDNESR